MLKLFVVGPSIGYARWIKNKELVDKIEDAELIMFTGGQDINPQIYGCEAHHSTYFSRDRDKFEINAYRQIRPDQLCIGICRGAQLACALNGGILVQDVTNHWIGGTHTMSRCSDIDMDDILDIPSLHHQMMYPYDMPKRDYTLMYVSTNQRSSHYEGDKITEKQISKLHQIGEPEVVLFHKEGNPRFLAIQGHPEMMYENSETVNQFNKILLKLLHNA